MTTATKTNNKQQATAGDALLSHLHQGGAWAHYWTDTGKESLWFPVDKRTALPAKWTRQNVYFSVHPCREIPPTNSKGEPATRRAVRVQNGYVAAVNCFYAEFDAKHWEGGKASIFAHLDTLPLYPSVIIDSGGGYHCYWLLEYTVTVTDDNRDTLRAMQAAWVQLVGGDDGSKDFARVLRVPGTLNVKEEYGPDFPTVTTIEANYKRLFPFVDFEEFTEHLRQTPEPEATPTPIQPTQRRSGEGKEGGVIQAYNDCYKIVDVLKRNGYTGDGVRLSRPDKAESGGVVIQTADNVSFHWSSNDPLHRTNGSGNPLPIDPFEAFCHFEHNGVMHEAVKAAAALVGMAYTNGNGHIPNEPPDWLDNEDWVSVRNVSRETADEDNTLFQTPKTPLAKLLEDLASIGDDRDDLTFYALDSVPQLAELDAHGFASFAAQLVSSGLPSEWVRRELRPAVNAVKKNQSNSKTWTDYVEAARTLGYSFRLNDLSDTVETNGERLTDVHEAVLLSKLHALGLRNADVARRAFTAAAAQARYHPVKEYLEGLQWDGKEHIGKLARYFSDKHDPITYADGTQRTVFHAFFHRWLVGAVGKVYNPTECQNPMLILAGGQGKGKSYFVKWLCPLPGLHIEEAIRPDDKDFTGYLTNHWVWEVGELGSTIRKADREALKAFITRQDATFRPAYGRHALVKPALASFIGTVNPEGALLADPTGHRRFWPVELEKVGESINWRYAQEVDVNQLWAQAYALYQAGESWQLSTEERAAHADIVELYEVEDILAGYVLEHFQVEPGNSDLFTYSTTIIDTLRTYAGVKGTEKGLAMQLSTTLTRLNLNKERRREGNNPRWGWTGIARKPD
jgi:hypothetical protein